MKRAWPRPVRVGLACLLLASLGAAAVLAYQVLQTYGIPCPTRTITGLYCPGCGMGRAFSALMRGEIGLAFRQNPAVLLILPWMGLYCGARLLDWALTGGNHVDRWVPDRVLLWMLIALFLFGVLRNIPLSCFDLLRPLE